MQLGEAKKKVWILLDEHTNQGMIDHDADIEAKLAQLFDVQQKRLAQKKKIVNTYQVPLVYGAGMMAYPMPSDFYRLKRLWVDGVPVARGLWRGNSLVMNCSESHEVIVEYYAYPADVGDDTPDNYELEIDEDAAICACYFVAADVLASDLVVDNGKLMAQAVALEQALNAEPEPITARVMTGFGIN